VALELSNTKETVRISKERKRTKRNVVDTSTAEKVERRPILRTRMLSGKPPYVNEEIAAFKVDDDRLAATQTADAAIYTNSRIGAKRE
jgi:hypothetical protein